MADPSPITIERQGLFAIIRGGRPYKAAIEAAGGRWRADGTYKIPLLVSTMNTLQRAGVPLGEYEAHISADPWLVEGREMPEWRPPAWDKLYEYQREAVQFMITNPYPGLLLALSPGLGKTICTIVAAQTLGVKTVLVVCPKVLRDVWHTEIEKWSGKVTGLDWTVVNYDGVVGHPDSYRGPYDIVVVDESVLAKNRKTKRVRALNQLRKVTERMWLLSGSPITKDASDLWAQLHLIHPAAFSSFWRFTETYCFVRDSIWGGKEITGSRSYATSAEFKDIMLTMHQSEVLPQLPEYLHQTITVELLPEQRERYRKAIDDMLIDLDGAEMPVTTRLAQLTRCQQIVAHPLSIDPTYVGSSAKEDAVEELVDSGAIELPVLIWVWFRAEGESMARRLHKLGKRVGLVLGDTPDADAVIAKFKGGEIDCLVVSILTGRFGLTLTAAKTIIYATIGFDADAYLQSLARVKRIGLSHRPRVIRLVAPGTTDALVAANLEGKLPAIAQISNSNLAELLRAL